MEVPTKGNRVDAEQFRLLVDAVADYAIFMLDPQGTIISWNVGAQRLKGYDADEVIGKHVSLFYLGEDLDAGQPQKLLEIARHHGRCEVEGWRLRKDGSKFWASVVITLLTDDLGVPIGFAKVTRDLTAKKLREEEMLLRQEQLERHVAERTSELSNVARALSQSEKRCRAIIDAFSVMVWRCEPTGDGWDSTPSWNQFTGKEDDVSRNWRWIDALHVDDQARVENDFQNAVLSQRAFVIEFRVRHKDGSLRLLSINGAPVFNAEGQLTEWSGICVDLTERRNLEEQVRQSQKMQAIGQLASGIAHDFNNYLTVILGYSELIEEENLLIAQHRESLNAIKESAQSAARLTQQLLVFSRQSIIEPTVLDINGLIRRSELLVRRLIGENIQLSIQLDPAICPVLADRTQLEQVLINLAVNARDAMPKGGTLTIASKHVELDSAYVNTHVEVDAGQYVLISVSDNGVGMTPEIRSRIFEPFYTTKHPGKGTGLGLSVVLGIVKQWKGRIGAYSEPGVGTTVKIYLPVTERSVQKISSADCQVLANASETVLLVEDDDAVRNFALTALSRYGYVVLIAANGVEALRLADAHPKIDLLITDVVMPFMSGPQLARELQARYAQLRVLYTSGYTDDAIVQHGLLNEKESFLQKPYTPTALARKAREVLNAAT